MNAKNTNPHAATQSEAQLAATSKPEPESITQLLHVQKVQQDELEQQNKELRHNQKSLEDERDYYLNLYEYAPVGYIILCANSAIENINLTGATLLGSEREQLINRLFTLQVNPADRERWQLFFWNLLRFNTHKSIELSLNRTDKRLLYVQLDGIAFTDPHGQNKVRLALTDISERKQAEIALKEDRLLAEKANRMKSEFLANMSHEIRTPMNAIVGLAYLMQESELTENQHCYLNKINIASYNLLRVINNILDFSKIESGQLELKKEKFLLDNLFSHLADMAFIHAKEKNLELIFSIAPQIPNQLIGDSLRLSQVLYNLLNNAVKFSNHGKVLISVVPLEQKPESLLLQFSVQDCGCGLSPEQIRLLFRPFSQTHTLIRRKGGGIGLGLVISQELVEQMGGKIKVQSQIDVGSTFYFSIPLSIAEPHFSEQMIDKTVHSQINLTGKKILLVEDDEFSRDLASELLKRLGIVVEVAENGLQAVWRVKNQAFDLVLMDVQMPEMNGLTATRLIRADKRFQNLPVIALTANSSHSDREKCLAAGMNDYLTKPIHPAKLMNILSYWLNEKSPQHKQCNP